MENTAEDKRKPEALDTFSTKERLFNKLYVYPLIIVITALLAYSNTFRVPFIFDDEPNIVNNPVIKDLNFYIEPSKAKVFEGFAEYPMLKQRYIGSLTFALNYRLHGLDVTGYHIVNLLIHIINTLLVYWFVLLTFKTPYFSARHKLKNLTTSSNAVLIALFSALLFVSHPIQTQAVTYIVQRFTSLATLFYLLSVTLYVRFRLNMTVSPKSITFYVLSIISAVLAMKTKEIAFTLPVVIALYEFLFFKEKIKTRLIYLIPLLLTMLIIPLTLIDLDKPVGELIGDVNEETMIRDVSRLDYLLTESRVIVTYIRLLFLPISQNLDHEYPLFHSFFNPQVFLSFLFLFSILGLGGYTLYQSSASEPGLRLAAFGIFWFFIALLVESSFIPLHVIYEHRMYLPSVGCFIALSTGASLLLEKFRRKAVRKAVVSFLVIVPMALSAATYARNTVWQSELTLWKDVVNKSPKKARGHNNLAVAYKSEGLVDKALKHYKIALRLEPNYADAHYNLGSLYGQEGLMEKAIEHLQTALRLNPDQSMAHNNLGNVYRSKGLLDKAMEHYKAALSLKHDHTSALNNLGIIYFSKGLTYKAIEYYQMALRIEPDFVNAHYNLGKAYRSKGLSDKAIEHYNRALSLKPDLVGAYLNLASIYKSRGVIDEAIEYYNRALNLDPDIAEAHYNIGNAYMSKGLEDKAIGHYKHAIRLNPQDPDAHKNLGVAYHRKGLTDKAQEQFQIAEKLRGATAPLTKN